MVIRIVNILMFKIDILMSKNVSHNNREICIKRVINVIYKSYTQHSIWLNKCQLLLFLVSVSFSLVVVSLLSPKMSLVLCLSTSFNLLSMCSITCMAFVSLHGHRELELGLFCSLGCHGKQRKHQFTVQLKAANVSRLENYSPRAEDYIFQ